MPIKQFASGKIIGQGFLFTLALVGKLVVGFMVPNFTQEKNFTGNHLRDCLIVGCSMVSLVGVMKASLPNIIFLDLGCYE